MKDVFLEPLKFNSEAPKWTDLPLAPLRGGRGGWIEDLELVWSYRLGPPSNPRLQQWHRGAWDCLFTGTLKTCVP